MKKTLLLLLLTGCCSLAAAQERSPLRRTEVITADSLDNDAELLERLRNMPNLEVGKGITFRPKSNWFSLTMRFRMQNMVGLSFDKDFTLTKTDAQVKRLRLRFDGHIYSPKLVYSIQLGFTSYDTEPLPNGNMNIVRDAIVYYVPSPKWNIGFGQTKIKANRARTNSSSALQFVDRSIVNSEFNLDRDFGFFGEYNMRQGDGFNLSAKGSVTLGEGRNWGSSSNGGLAYTGRLELYPLGRFKSKGDVLEGDFEGEEQVRILLAGAYSYNHKASRLKGQRGAVMPDDATRNLGAYFRLHPQIPGIRILYRLHGPQLRRTAVRSPEQRLRIQRAGSQRADQLPVRQEMGDRPAQLDALPPERSAAFRRIQTLEPDHRRRHPLHHRTQPESAGRHVLQPPQRVDRPQLQPLGDPVPAGTGTLIRNTSFQMKCTPKRDNFGVHFNRTVCFYRILSAIRAQASASARAW